MIRTIDPDRFLRAFEMLSLVDAGRVRPLKPLAGEEFELDGERYVLPDNPLTRMADAVRSVFPDPDEGIAALRRMMHLLWLVGSQDLGPLVHKGSTGLVLGVHQELVRAVAEAEFSSDFSDPSPLEVSKLLARATERCLEASA